MRIDGAESVVHGKWRAHLACGHVVVCDVEVTSPVDGEIECPICGDGSDE